MTRGKKPVGAAASGGDLKSLPLFCLAAILFFISIAAYYPVLNHTFHQWDDDTYITTNKRVMSGLNPGNVKWAFSTTYFGFYYPLTWLSHMTDVQLYGLDPKGHYRTSILLHSFNVVLFFIFLCASTKACYRSFFAAMLFALHPMNVESVAWLAERKNLLSVFFLLLALIFYVLKVKNSAGGRRSLFYTCALYLFFIMGLMSKSSIVTFPLLLLLLDLWPLGRASFDGLAKQAAVLKKLVIEKAPLFILSFISGILTIAAQKETDAVASLALISIPQRAGEAFLGFGFYLQKLFLPLDLCAFYPHHNGNYPLFLPFLVLAVMLVLSLFFWSRRRTSPVLITGWLFFIVSLLPVIGIIQAGSQAYADRYSYFSYWGLFMIMVFGIAWEKLAFKNFGLKILLVALSLVLMSSLFITSRTQAEKWKDDEALFSSVIRVSPETILGYLKLGDFYMMKGNLDKALQLFQKAYEIQDDNPKLLCDIGLTYSKMKDFDKALEYYDRAIELEPGFGLTYYDKACALVNMKRGGEALKNIELALKYGCDPSIVTEAENAARVNVLSGQWKEYSRLEKWDEAGSALKKALELAPERADLWCYMGYILQKKNDPEGAVTAYERALALDDSLDVALHNLAMIEIGKKDVRKARERLAALEEMNSPYAAGLKEMLDKK